jgi:hypothetical protein
MSHGGGHVGGGGHYGGGHHQGAASGGYVPTGRGRRPGPWRTVFALLFGAVVVVLILVLAH